MGLRVAYITAADPTNKQASSGTIHAIARTLQKYCTTVEFVGPIDSFARKGIARLLDLSVRFLLEEGISEENLLFVAKRHAQIVAERIKDQHFDALIAPMAAPEIAFLRTSIPIFLIEECPFALPYTYYPDYTDLINWSIQQGSLIEMAAYANSSAILFCSSWAAKAAITDYQADPQKVYVLPFGANLDTIPPKEIALTRKRSYRCTLLFIGNDWEKKGGAIAFETLLALESFGIEAELIVCGNPPPRHYTHDRMKFIPFLDKNDESQRNELERLYRTTDFLILPTRAESYNTVCCEANAYGVPCLIAQIGSANEIIQHGENGFILPYHAQGQAYAEIIAEIYHNEILYTHLTRSSRQIFEERLNWDVWGKKLQQLIRHIHP